MRRVFFAIALPETALGALRVLQFLLPLPKPVPPENFHLTLCYLGEVQEDLLLAVHEAISGLRLQAFDMALSGVGMFGSHKPRLVWAGIAPNDALTSLQGKVETTARRAGVHIPAQRYVPHVTLGHCGPMAPDAAQALELAIVAQNGFRVAPFPVTQFGLYESLSGPRGHRYEALAEYDLKRLAD